MVLQKTKSTPIYPISFKNKFVELEDDARCVFWLSVKDIREAYNKSLFSNQIVRYVVAHDLHGRTHRGAIPLRIKKILFTKKKPPK